MSHFAVCVFTKNGSEDEVAKLLAPYQENNMEDCPKEFLEFFDAEEKYRDEYLNESNDMVKCPDGSLKSKWDNMFKVEHDTYKIPDDEGYEVVSVPNKDLYSFDEFLEEYCGFKKDTETGKYGYWENPNAKWDWWQVGGRYSGLLRLKNGAKSNSAPIKNIDPNPTSEEIREEERFWEIVVEGQELMEGEEKPFNFYKPEYFLEQYGTKENYVKANTGLSCWAFVDNEGWHEQGEMGWWCANDATKESRDSFREHFYKALENADPESYITVVDCHI